MNKAFKQEFIKIAKEDKLFDNETRKSLLAGFGAGSTSAIILSPVDIVKDVMRTRKGWNKNFWDTAKHLYEHEGGAKAFYRGVAPTVAKLGLGTAVVFGSNQMYKELLDKHYPKINNEY